MLKRIINFLKEIYSAPIPSEGVRTIDIQRRHAVDVAFNPPQLSKQEECDHGVYFNVDEAYGLSTTEIKRRWPRGFGPCPKGCGFDGIAYASYAHYIYGDW